MGKHTVVRTEEHKRKIAEAHRGKIFTEEHRRHIAEAKTGTVMSEQQKEQLRLSNTREGNPFFGREHSPEMKKKLSESRIGTCRRLGKYGVSQEQYAAEIAAGNRWCCIKKHFMPASQMTSKKAVCVECKTVANRAGDLKKHFGITPGEYESIFEAQGRCCAICGSTKRAATKKNMPIDHNHRTGKIRGILCYHCNFALERLESIENWALKALAYLARYA